MLCFDEGDVGFAAVKNIWFPEQVRNDEWV